ncbi:outer membrane protein assembly factor BamE domain-containing protein [Nevskia sp.]|uniref:outer membrane protein assembly factor BamE domain-containing protein n=1 Tax=Nevskia sp. TaxID=1929292 RepID=UPI003F704BFA
MNMVRRLLLCCVIGLAACSSKVTAENYDKISPGMSREDVHAILGKPDDSRATDVGGVLSLSKETWTAGDKTLTVTYGNNKVALKSFN